MLSFLKNNGSILLLCGFVCFIAFGYFNPQKQEEIKGSSFARIDENIIRAQTEIVKTIILPEMDKRLKERIQESNVQMYSYIESLASGGTQTSFGSEIDRFTEKYKAWQKKTVYWKSQTGEKFPIAVVFYNPEKNKWKVQSYKINFKTEVIQQKFYDGTIENYVQMNAEHPNLKKEHGGWVDKSFPISVSDKTKFQIKNPNEMKFSLWNPVLSGGFVSGINNSGFMFKYNFMNIGFNKDLPVYQFGSPVFFLNNTTPLIGLEFVSWNIGNDFSIIKDLHLGGGIFLTSEPFISLTSVF